MNKSDQAGQIVVILLLIIVISLAIGLSVASRSVSEIAISTKSEQSQRAFSAAEGALERAIRRDALQQLTPGAEVNVTFPDNQSAGKASASPSLPHSGQALEYPFPPGVGKADFAHFWLANPDSLAAYYTGRTIWVYFGNPEGSSDYEEDNKPAIEVNLITRSKATPANYFSIKYFYDSDLIRTSKNNFKSVPAGGCNNPTLNISINVDPNVKEQRKFYCKVQIPSSVQPEDLPIDPNHDLILTRIRILYSDKKQRLAVEPVAGASLPPAVKLVTSTGTSGQLQRKLQLFSTSKVVPPFLDYAIFSTGAINKSQ